MELRVNFKTTPYLALQLVACSCLKRPSGSRACDSSDGYDRQSCGWSIKASNFRPDGESACLIICEVLSCEVLAAGVRVVCVPD